MKIIRLLLILLFFGQISFAQSWQDTLSLIDKSFAQYQGINPGCQVSVSRNGQIIFSKAWGSADLERNVPLSTQSVLESGSVAKQFTAAAILLLEQQGKLSVRDNVQKYIPELPDYGHPIKISDLIHHTSGIREWTSLVRLTGWARTKRFYTNEDVLDLIVRQKYLNNQPGAEFLYSNSNYILLAIIVQRASGLTLAAFTRQYIFEPAGMTHTQWRDNPNRVVPNRAIAYSKSGSSYESDMPNEYVHGPGGLLTTTEDLLKWNYFYQQGRLGTSPLLSSQLQTEPIGNGEMSPYAAGLFIRKVKGWNSISHDGATASYRSFLETFPELNLCYAVLSNTSAFNIRNVAGRISELFVPDKTKKNMEKPIRVDLPEGALRAFEGLYRNERDRSTFLLSVKNNQLVLDDELPLTTVSANTFKAGNFVFVMKEGKGLYIPGSPRDSIPFTKVEPVDLPSKDLNVYEGAYFSEEINSSLVVRNDKAGLIVHLRPNLEYPLEQTYKDGFKINPLDCDLHFVRDGKNKILSMHIDFSDARDIEFKKIK